jgi:hypothetical protein
VAAEPPSGACTTCKAGMLYSVINTVEAYMKQSCDAGSAVAKIVTRAGSAVQADWAQRDGLLRDVLVFPPSTDLHDHPLVSDRSLILQVSMLIALPVWAASAHITYACPASVQRHRHREYGHKLQSPRAQITSSNYAAPRRAGPAAWRRMRCSRSRACMSWTAARPQATRPPT